CRRGSRASRSPRRSSAPSSPRGTTSSPARRRSPPWCCRSWSRPPERCWAPRRGTPWPLPCGPPAYIYKTTMTTRPFPSRPAPPGMGGAAVRLRGLPLAILPLAAPDWETAATRLDPLGQLGLIVVDYLQLVPSPAGAARPTQDEDLALALQRLKALALERQVAALVVSQLPRFDAKRPNPRPSLDDFGHLGAIKQQIGRAHV